MDKCTDVPLKDQLQVGGWSSPALTKKALAEIERLEKENRSLKRLAGRHEAAWDTLDYLCDYDAGSPDYTKGLAWVRRKIAELRPGAEESNG